MRKFYLAFPICETVSHKLTLSHYFELLKCDNSLKCSFIILVSDKKSIDKNDIYRHRFIVGT